MVEEIKAEKTISAIVEKQEQVDSIIKQLVERGIPSDNISVMGKDFQSQTRIAGFITKKDVILDGLKQGAIFGSLFGSVLSLLTGVGILFIPFVGSVVAAGPISAILLGATSGAIAGSAGAGLVSALMTLGMPEEKATIYQTMLQAGKFLMMAEVPADKASELQTLMESAGAQELHLSDSPLPRSVAGRYNSPKDLSPEVRSHLSEEAQQTFIERYNSALEQSNDPKRAEHDAWDAIEQHYDKDEHGFWSKTKVTA
jgi:cation transport regulator ChaB